MQRYTTNTIAGFNVVFDEDEKEDVFVTLIADGTHENVARELNAGVAYEDVVLKYDTSNRT